ncbi:tetratricopeptide repeat protein, partial [Dolichospermum sp. ST_sed5]|nr:tetratricopeptide repeat protein [Dolichospermum sp. ST_sed5]
MNSEALADFNTVISKMNGDASFLQSISTEYNPYNWRGWIKLETKDYYGGVYDFTQSINQNNSNKNVIYSCEGRGMCYYNQNMFKEANEDFSRVISLDPNRLTSLKWRAHLLSKEEKYTGAINDYLKIIDLEPNGHKIYNDLGVCYVRLKNYQQAYIQYKKASDIAPEKALYYGNAAICVAYMDKFDEAYKSINKAIELDSLNHYSYFQKARIFSLNGKRSEANSS